RHVGGNAQHLTGANHDLPAVDPELERTLHDIGELLIHVAVLGDHAALLEQHARQHQVLTGNHLAIQKRVQFFQLNVIPADVLKHNAGYSIGLELRPPRG